MKNRLKTSKSATQSQNSIPRPQTLFLAHHDPKRGYTRITMVSDLWRTGPLTAPALSPLNNNNINNNNNNDNDNDNNNDNNNNNNINNDNNNNNNNNNNDNNSNNNNNKCAFASQIE
jgi:hypothetical protein